MIELIEFTLTDGDESITVPATIIGIAKGLVFKANHIKARTDPAFFEAAAVLISELNKKIIELSMENQILKDFNTTGHGVKK